MKKKSLYFIMALILFSAVSKADLPKNYNPVPFYSVLPAQTVFCQATIFKYRL